MDKDIWVLFHGFLIIGVVSAALFYFVVILG